MPRGDWHRHVAYIGLASVVVGLVVAPILVTGQDQWRDRQKYEQQTQAAYEEAGRRFSLLSEVDQRASTDARERAREDRENSDLSAQWATARWTLTQFIVGAVGLVLTGGALIFAYLAWKASKTGVEVTRDIGQKQVRAYLSIGDASFHLTEHKKDGEEEVAPHMEIKIDIRNTGQSVAQRLTLNFQALMSIDGQTRGELKESMDVIDVAANSTESAQDSFTYKWDPAFPLDDALKIGSVDMILFVTVTGRDVFKKPLDRVWRAYRFAPDTFYTSDDWNKFGSTSWRPRDEVVDRED